MPARDGQFFREMVQDGVCHAEVAFGVFEVNGVHFVRHGGGADFARFDFLAVVSQRDVAPDVAVGVDKDGVDAREGVEVFGHVVMWLDLDGVGVVAEAERGFDEVAAVAFPVFVRIGDEVRVVVADGAVDFAEQRLGAQLGDLSCEALMDVGDFFAEGGRGGWLAVGAAHHGHGGMGVRHVAQFGGDAVKGGQEDVIARVA